MANHQANAKVTWTSLHHVSDDHPGIHRRRCGKGFTYIDSDAKRIQDKTVLQRIRALVIPPAWTDVWICADPQGYLQATGRDARQRKQYRYHRVWRNHRDHDKFSRMLQFGEQLPALRRQLRRDLALPTLSCDKVLAIVVSLLDRTLIRIGNDEYARDNATYGLTTLHTRHLKFLRDGRARLSFRGKSGKRQEQAVDDRRMVRLLRRCSALPGYMLFQYIDDAGNRQAVDSAMVNDYLHAAMGQKFTAKDFRTWGGTLLAITTLLREPVNDDPRAKQAAAMRAVKQAAAALGNSPSVCRNAYIHPKVFVLWHDTHKIQDAPMALAGQSRHLEKFVLHLLHPRSR